MKRETTPLFWGGRSPSRLLPVLAAAIAVSAAFVCAVGDCSEADATDFEKSVYAKVKDLGFEDYSGLISTMEFTDSDFLDLIFNNLSGSDYSTLELDAEGISDERGESNVRSGTTIAKTQTHRISAKNIELTRTVVQVPDPVYKYDSGSRGAGMGFLKIMQYLGDEPIAEGTVIEGTCSEFSASCVSITTSVYRTCAEGYLLTGETIVSGIQTRAVFSYKIDSDDAAKSFDLIVDSETYTDVTTSYAYMSDIPIEDQDMYQTGVRADKVCNNTSVNVRVEGKEYPLCQNLSSKDIEAEKTSENATWKYYDGTTYVGKEDLDIIPEDLSFQDFFDNLSGDNDTDAETIRGLGGTASVNIVSDVDRLTSSVKDGMGYAGSGNGDRATIYAAAAAGIIVAVVILALMFWKPGTLSKGRKKEDGQQTVPDDTEAEK